MAAKNTCYLLKNSNKLYGIKVPITNIVSRKHSSWNPVDKETHTGQKFDPEDKRLARFVDRIKEVNNEWAINLIDREPPREKENRIVSCNGGDGPLGHPKVYINLDKPGNHTCGYCGLRFYKDQHH